MNPDPLRGFAFCALMIAGAVLLYVGHEIWGGILFMGTFVFGILFPSLFEKKDW